MYRPFNKIEECDYLYKLKKKSFYENIKLPHLVGIN